MDSTCDLILDSFKEEPIGETDHFIWFITDIGIVALFKKEKIFYFAHRRFNLINILWKTLLKNTKKVDNSRGA